MLKSLLDIFHGRLNAENSKIITNIGWLTAERVFRMAVGFLTLAWTARFLGVDQFGSLNYALAFVAIFSPLGQLAADQITFRDLVNSPEKKNTILGTSFVIKFVAGIFVFILSVISILLLKSGDILICKLVIIIATSSFFGGFNVIELWFQSQIDSKYIVSARNTAFVVATIIRIVLLQSNAPIVFFAWLVTIESLLNVVAFIFVFNLAGNRILAWNADWKLARELMHVSFPLIFSTFAIVVYMRIDQIMLGQLADTEAVGNYSAAVKLSEIWPFASTMIVKSVAPSIIAAKKVSESLYYQKLQKLSNFQAGLVYCVAIPMTFLSTPFVILVFGEEFAPAGIVLSIHIWSSMFLFLGYVKEIWITTEGITWFAFWFTIVGAATNIVLNSILIPPYREVGAAIATVISYGFADYVMCFLHPSARRFGWIMTQAMSLNLIRPKDNF